MVLAVPLAWPIQNAAVIDALVYSKYCSSVVIGRIRCSSSELRNAHWFSGFDL